MATHSQDIVVIGGGIVGLATALSLALSRPQLRLAILEAEDRLAAHQTGHNSGVIHSGIYYKPGSLKARLCVEGRQRLERFCAEHGLAYERCGKMIVATRAVELPPLAELERRGRANGLEGLQRLTAAELREREPQAAGLAGLWVPQTGIVDFAAVARTYARLVMAAGAELHLSSRVRAVYRAEGGYVLETDRQTVRCAYLINCAGLQSDRLARMCGCEPDVQIVPFRGEYYELVPEKRNLVRGLIYPVPNLAFPFLGVHFTRRIDGTMEAGPNAVLALRREGYRMGHVSLTDLGEMLRFGGFWCMAQRYWCMGLGEVYRSVSKAAFVRALRKLLPALQPEDLRPGGAGVRAQAVDRAGNLIDDFRILTAERAVHVLNAPSPAATASLAIGETIAATAARHFDLRVRHSA